MSKIYVDEILPKDAASISMDGSGLDLSNATLPSGCIIQVQSKVLVDEVVYSTAVGHNDIPGLNVTITPKYSNSKFKIYIRLVGEVSGASPHNTLLGLRYTISGGSAGWVNHGTHNTNYNGLSSICMGYHGDDQGSTADSFTATTVTSIATSSPITFQVTMFDEYNRTHYVNRCVNSGNEAYSSEIIVEEIAQ